MYPLYIKISGYKVGTEGTKREEKAKMRGFLQVKAKAEGMGEGSYAHFINEGKREDRRTEDAKRRFKTPAYYFGERRKNDQSSSIFK